MLAVSLLPLVVLSASVIQDPPQSPARAEPEPVEVRIVADGVRRKVFLGEDLFTVYRPDVDPAQPVLFPVYAPDQIPLMRQFPLAAAAADEAEDHPHHRSLWFAHGSLNGYDFWHGTRSGDVIVHAAYLPVERGDEARALRTRNVLVGHDGTVVCTEERYMRFGVTPAGTRTLDLRVTLFADHGPLRFGDTKEGTMAFRMAPWLRLRGPVARGAVVNSEGVTGKAAWGKRARWVAYSGPVTAEPEAAQYGLALMDHPRNLRHPCWWHARDYGLLAANPFGQHDFERAPQGAGDYEVPAGDSLSFSYRFVFFAGASDTEALGRLFDDFAAASLPADPRDAAKRR